MGVIKQVPREGWAVYFKEFARRQLRSGLPTLATVEVMSLSIGDQPEATLKRLNGIDYDPKSNALEVVLEEDVDHLVWYPTEIWVVEEDDGFISALEVTRSDGTKEVMRFQRGGVPAPIYRWLASGLGMTSNVVPAPPASGVIAHGLAPGVAAPEWGAAATREGRRVELAEYRGSPVVLIFYPGDFTPVCTNELGLFNELLPDMEEVGAHVLAISCDSLWSHMAYARELNLKIPLVSDFHPKGEVSRRYDVFREDIGTSERALFVLDRDGTIFWSHVSPIEVNPGADGVLDALERLTGHQAPAQESRS